MFEINKNIAHKYKFFKIAIKFFMIFYKKKNCLLLQIENQRIKYCFNKNTKIATKYEIKYNAILYIYKNNLN